MQTDGYSWMVWWVVVRLFNFGRSGQKLILIILDKFTNREGRKWIMQEKPHQAIGEDPENLGWRFAECDFVENQVFLGKTEIMGSTRCEAGILWLILDWWKSTKHRNKHVTYFELRCGECLNLACSLFDTKFQACRWGSDVRLQLNA